MLPQNPYSRICNFGVNNRDHDQLLPALVPRAKLLRRYVMSTAIAPGEDPPVSMKATVIRRLSMAVGLLGLVSFGLVFPFPLRGRLWAELFNMAHAPVFFIALLSLTALLDPPAIGLPSRFTTLIRMTFRRVLVVTVCLMILGLVGEYLQQFANRTPSYADVTANLSGLLAGLFWVAAIEERGRRRLSLFLATGITLLGATVMALANSWDCIQQYREFPQLSSFERPLELNAWEAHAATIIRSTDWSTEGEYSAAVAMGKEQYSSVSLEWFDGDWSAFSQVQMDLRNPSPEAQDLMLKVFDREHEKHNFDYDDRFHQEVHLPAGEAITVMVSLDAVKHAPTTREMNMTDIRILELYAIEPKEAFVFFIDNVRLIP